MILLCGIPTERPMAMVARELEALGAPFVVFNQRAFADTRFAFSLSSAGVTGTLQLGCTRLRLEEIGSVYTRLMDDRVLPELDAEPSDSEVRKRCRGLHDGLLRWLDIAPVRVVNRSFPMSSNSSKPYQAQLIRACGIDVPETLVTNDPQLVHEFRARHGRVVFKSISSFRSIVRELDTRSLSRLEHIRWCPVQFQELVEGVDVRVHVIGEEVYATRISSAATDYRYADAASGDSARLEPTRLPDAVQQRCLALSRLLGLPFAGIDLRITTDSRVVCFEVNPCPAFSYYESHTGQPIANAVARYLRDAMA